MLQKLLFLSYTKFSSSLNRLPPSNHHITSDVVNAISRKKTWYKVSLQVKNGTMVFWWWNINVSIQFISEKNGLSEVIVFHHHYAVSKFTKGYFFAGRSAGLFLCIMLWQVAKQRVIFVTHCTFVCTIEKKTEDFAN